MENLYLKENTDLQGIGDVFIGPGQTGLVYYIKLMVPGSRPMLGNADNGLMTKFQNGSTKNR